VIESTCPDCGWEDDHDIVDEGDEDTVTVECSWCGHLFTVQDVTR
jgi:uncharacterized Zn finger protein